MGEYSNFFPGEIYENTIILSTVELAGYIFAGVFYDRLGPKKLFFISYVLSIVGGIGVLIANVSELYYMDMICTYLAKFAISSAYNGVYNANSLFPIFFSSTTFGVCNCFGGFAYIIGTFLLDLSENLNFILFITFSGIATLLSLFIKDTSKIPLMF